MAPAQNPRSGVAIRVEADGLVRRLVLCRPDEYDTITPGLRDEVGAALGDADRDDAVARGAAVRGTAGVSRPALDLVERRELCRVGRSLEGAIDRSGAPAAAFTIELVPERRRTVLAHHGQRPELVVPVARRRARSLTNPPFACDTMTCRRGQVSTRIVGRSLRAGTSSRTARVRGTGGGSRCAASSGGPVRLSRSPADTALHKSRARVCKREFASTPVSFG